MSSDLVARLGDAVPGRLGGSQRGARLGAPPGVHAWATAIVVALGVALAGPEWAPHAWTREDGPIEFAGFACFAVASVLAVAAAAHLRSDRRAMIAAAALGVVLFLAAGEEISWGQRLFDLDTPEVLVDGNRQDELNLHNLEGLQGKAIVAQLAVAGAGFLLPWLVRARWARVGFPFFAGYLAYRVGRGIAALADLGPADRNSEVAELVLAMGLLALTAMLLLEVRRVTRPTGPPASNS